VLADNSKTVSSLARLHGNVAYLVAIFLAFSIGQLTPSAEATPLQDQAQFRQHYREHFPNLLLSDYAIGVYAIDPIARQSWQAIEEFPPYEPAIEQGKQLFGKAFKNGRHYADCLARKGIGISHTYPRWDNNRGEVITLALALNDCRIKNQESTLAYDKGDLVYLQAYLAYTSRGKTINTKIPKNNTRALAAYEQGKAFYYSRRGQLNFACATCHVQNVGKKLRAEILSPSLGHTNNWPTYRLKWGEIGSLHRRFAECLGNIKASSFPEQSREFRNLEYFLSFMGNGVPITGPSVRK
jgi:L-cysteine S-thiosulfotransferase